MHHPSGCEASRDVKPMLNAMNDDAAQPSFGLAIVMVAGFVTSYATMLFIGFAPYVSRGTWSLLMSLIGAVALRFVLRVIGYEISYVAAVAALLIGSLISILLARTIPAASPTIPLLPALGLFVGIPSVLLSAWIVQMTATRPNRNALP